MFASHLDTASSSVMGSSSILDGIKRHHNMGARPSTDRDGPSRKGWDRKKRYMQRCEIRSIPHWSLITKNWQHCRASLIHLFTIFSLYYFPEFTKSDPKKKTPKQTRRNVSWLTFICQKIPLLARRERQRVKTDLGIMILILPDGWGLTSPRKMFDK